MFVQYLYVVAKNYCDCMKLMTKISKVFIESQGTYKVIDIKEYTDILGVQVTGSQVVC